MLYSKHIDKDIKAHEAYHKEKLNSSIKCSPLIQKEGTTVLEYADRDGTKRILKYSWQTCKTSTRKFVTRLNKVLDAVQMDLGGADIPNQCFNSMVVYICIQSDFIIGSIFAFPLENGLAGISRVWVSKSYRRKGVATKMLDALRSSFALGMKLDKANLAFSQPTTDGSMLAQSYAGENYKTFSEV
ncbi:hypothetical protein ROZALSC1DRAFT_21631 [Rozella allomycis CSF55]|uniref:N-acetyltransferase ESCO acetyl-transferase domain-containing protein n=1 Tax=Rozella allomycis (strain CSF55) TaxID=988480 RepID=A0A4P9YKN4_ROZAC|nr:hypothetical protein ROZALSC1DRAFT_21631 [Rozella allomycis CSF55]